MDSFGQKEGNKIKYKELQHAVDKLSNFMLKNMKENNIPRLA